MILLIKHCQIEGLCSILNCSKSIQTTVKNNCLAVSFDLEKWSSFVLMLRTFKRY